MIFKEIPGIDSRYLAGDDGFIYSDMKKTRKKLSPGKNNAYLNVSILTEKGRRVSRNVHFLICCAFKGKRGSGKLQAAHIDGNAGNNLPSNLMWKTVSANLADRKIHGTHDGGVANTRSAFSNEEIREVKQLLQKGKMLHREIAEKFGVARGTISKINTGTRHFN